MRKRDCPDCQTLVASFNDIPVTLERTKRVWDDNRCLGNHTLDAWVAESPEKVGPMRETTGDIWEWAERHADACCVLTNMTVAGGKLIMGGGQAREARVRYPELPEYWGKFYGAMEAESITATFCYHPRKGYTLISFPTKRHPSEDSSLKLIEDSANLLVEVTDRWQFKSVVLPRPGCGLGGLKWDDVQPVLYPILDDRFVVITNT